MPYIKSDEVKFGDVVKAPPRLSAKPRGSDKKKTKMDTETNRIDDIPVLGLRHKQDIKEERTRVIDQYRLSKKINLNKRTRC